MKIFSSLVFALFFPLLIVEADVPINNAPIADANGPYKAVVETVVIFDGSGSSDPEDDSLTYDWDFGDGNSGSGVSASHVYTESGNFTVTLTVNDGEFSDSDTSSVRIFLRPPAAPSSFLIPPTPANNKEASLETDLSLIFKWEEVSNAQQYRAKYWVEGDESNAVNQIIPGEERGFAIEYDALRNGRYFWQVKSCADLDENGTIQESVDFNGDGIMESECGDYSDVRSFIYPLEETISPPEKSQITYPDLDPGKVIVDWPDIESANSYIVKASLDLGCSWTKKIWGLFAGGDCDPFQGLVDNMTNWVYEKIGLPLNYNPSCPWILWDESEGCSTIDIRATSTTPATSIYEDTDCVFSKGEKYQVRIASCLDGNAQQCGKFSEASSLHVSDGISISAPTPLEPAYAPGEIPTIGRKDALVWDSDSCANYVRLTAAGVIDDKMPNQYSLDFSHEKFNDIFDNSNDLDKIYSWQVESCWRISSDIKCEGAVSPLWKFKTVGAPPQLLKPADGEIIKIPVKLEWAEIDAADSYYYQVAADASFSDIKKEGLIANPNVKIDHSFIDANDQYWWRIKTCAFKDWENQDLIDANLSCGDWSEKRVFSTLPLNPPANLGPTGGPLPGALKWDADPGANFYQYKIDYISLDYQKPTGEPATEVLEGCSEKVGTPIYAPTIASRLNATLLENCLGRYRWWVRSCLDKDCSIAAPSDWVTAPNSVFTAFESLAGAEKGIVPCGRRSDNPDTPYNEREACSVRHIGIILQNLLDFLLWRLGLIFLGIFSIMTGAISYFSLGGPGTLDRIKSIWKSAGIGYGIMLISWILVNLILSIAGFQVQFFGRWFQLPF